MSCQPGDAAAAAARLQDTVADGRLANPFYRQQQLREIQKSLIESKDTILDALVKDSLVTTNEAFAEFYSTVSAVKSYFDQSSPTEALKAEYAVTRNQDDPSARQGLGIVVIKPQLHTFLFSTISSLCAALASGNAILIVLKKPLHHLTPVITKLLKESLDSGIVEIASSKPTGLGTSLCVDQLDEERSVNTLSCSQQARTVAIVDRTCAVRDAARSLLFARTGFGGTSPYAPDIIFVNEFIKSDFLHALMTCCLESHDSYPSDFNGHLPTYEGITGNLAHCSKLISTGTWGRIVEITQRECLASIGKVQERTFYVHAFRSLEDVIEVANNFTPDHKLAAFSFGDSKTCKYLLQFVNADAGFANIVPKELLVGPAAPRGYPIELGTRYSVDMFSVPRPRYSQKTALSSVLDGLLSGNTSAVNEIKMLDGLMLPKRGPIKQDTGYFERGVVVGASAILLPIVVGAGTALFFAAKSLIRRYTS